jgi:hypothetical protein
MTCERGDAVVGESCYHRSTPCRTIEYDWRVVQHYRANPLLTETFGSHVECHVYPSQTVLDQLQGLLA